MKQCNPFSSLIQARHTLPLISYISSNYNQCQSTTLPSPPPPTIIPPHLTLPAVQLVHRLLGWITFQKLLRKPCNQFSFFFDKNQLRKKIKKILQSSKFISLLWYQPNLYCVKFPQIPIICTHLLTTI